MNGSSPTEGERLFSANSVNVIKMLCYSFIILVGSLGNFAICLSFLVKKQLKNSEYFVLNLTITDLCVCMVSVPFDLAEIALGYWPFGSFLCKVIYPLQTVLMGVSVFTLLCMALERHRAITKPLKERIKKRHLLCIIFLTWAVCIGLVSPYISVLKEENQKCTENWPPGDTYVKAYTMCSFLIFYLFPLIIILVAYIRVGIRMCQDAARFKTILGTTRKSSAGRRIMDRRSRRNLRIVKIFVSAVVSFALCLLPFHVMWLWSDFGGGSHWAHFKDVMVFANVLLYANSMIDPFIFGALTRRCRSCVGFKQSAAAETFRSLTSKKSTYVSYSQRKAAIRTAVSAAKATAYDGLRDNNEMQGNGEFQQLERPPRNDFHKQSQGLVTKNDCGTLNNCQINYNKCCERETCL